MWDINLPSSLGTSYRKTKFSQKIYSLLAQPKITPSYGTLPSMDYPADAQLCNNKAWFGEAMH